MNKVELVDAVAQKAGLTKNDVDAVLSMTVEAIIEAVSKGEKVMLIGFGTFESRDRQARVGRNPSTGEPLQIPATTVPAFSAGKLFKWLQRRKKRKRPRQKPKRRSNAHCRSAPSRV